MTGRTKSKRKPKVIPEAVKSKEDKQPEQEKAATKPAKNAKTASLPEPAKPPAESSKSATTLETSKASPTPSISPKEVKQHEQEKENPAKNDNTSSLPEPAKPSAESHKTATTPKTMTATPAPPISAPSRGPQCYKCQRWGHLSFGCKNDTRCVKCAKGHRASECPKKPEDPCRCANCHQSHPASYRGCAAAPKTRRRKSKPKQTQNEGKEKSVISKLANVLCKLMLTKDFFTQEQLELISIELEEKPKIATCHTSTQVETTPTRNAETSTTAAQTDPDKKIRTNTTWTQTEQSMTETSDEDNQTFQAIMERSRDLLEIMNANPAMQAELMRIRGQR